MATEARLLMRKLYLGTKKYFLVYICPLRGAQIHLRQMLKQYEEWRQLIKDRKNGWNTQTEKKGIDEFERYIVHYLLEICFWVSYGDSDVVSNLLSILCETDGHFEEIFCELPVRSLDSKKYGLEDLDKMVRNPWSWEEMVKNPLTGDKIEFWERPKQEQQRINYFIKHSSKKKLLFLRFGESWLRYKMKTNSVPTYSMLRKSESIFFTDPDILLKFLDHGLFVNADRCDESVGRLLKGIIEIWISEVFITESLDSPDNTLALEVAARLLRAVKSVDIYGFFQSYDPPSAVVRIVGLLVLLYKKQDVLPMLKTWCSGLQKLQHLCRWQIRKQMCDCGQLPGGISFLPIPKRLQQYLNLRLD